jgi:hypothetical protein
MNFQIKSRLLACFFLSEIQPDYQSALFITMKTLFAGMNLLAFLLSLRKNANPWDGEQVWLMADKNC